MSTFPPSQKYDYSSKLREDDKSLPVCSLRVSIVDKEHSEFGSGDGGDHCPKEVTLRNQAGKN